MTKNAEPILTTEPATPRRAILSASDARRSLWSTVALYFAAALLSLGAVVCVMHLWQANLRVPFNYEGDGLLNITIVKVMLEHGWYWHTADLGAPAGMHLEDYPAADNLCCLMMKCMSLFTSDPVLLTNLFYLLTFPLVACAALFTLRELGISRAPALLASLLYTWLPYHFWRSTVHLSFSAYFLVPPAILIAWWISSRQLFARRGRLYFAAGVALLLGCDMAYYPFFACFLLLVASVIALLRGDWRHALGGGAVIAVVSLVLVLNLLPNLIYAHQHGAAISGKRYPFEAELSGLKIAQLLLPTTGHRIDALAELKSEYNGTHPLVNENDWVSLGFIGSLGFLVLIGWVLFVRPGRTLLAADPAIMRPEVVPALTAPESGLTSYGLLIEHASVFNLAALLLGTLGGFSSLFAVLVTPQIRAYNRICVFIAFLAFLTVAVGLDLLARRWICSRPRAVAYCTTLALLGALGLLDQTGADARRNWTKLDSLYRNDSQFFAVVQKSLPRGSMTFEVPYEPFPEYGSTMYQMVEYAEFRPYLHTHGLRWSYGVIKGRPGDTWEKDTAALAPKEMIDALRRAGFTALYIDRTAYADHATKLENAVHTVLGSSPMTDRMGRFLLFNLGVPSGPAASLESILPLPLPTWGNGFYDLEVAADKSANWRWCATDGEMTLLNDSGHLRKVRLDANLRSGMAPAVLQIRGGSLISEDVNIDPAGTTFSRVLELPPGNTIVRFHCETTPLPKNTGDPRTLVWRMDDFLMTNAN